MIHHALELLELVNSICSCKMLQSQGYLYVNILGQYANVYFSCGKLRLMLHPPQEKTSAIDNSCLQDVEYIDIINDRPDLPVKLTDYQTIKLIRDRFVVLRNLEREYRVNNDYARLDDVLQEIDDLNAYLEETTTPYGIKTTLTELQIKDYHAVQADIRRFLLKVKQLNETLYWQIKAHLKIGLQCAWVDD